MAHISNDQVQFIVSVSMATRIDPRVVIAWMAQEGAFSGKESGRYNYLNVMDASGHPTSYGSVKEAAASTVRVIRQPNMKPIIGAALAKVSPKEQIAAIAATPWDSSHYGGNGGQNLAHTFASIFGGNAGLNDSYVAPAQARAIASTALTGSATIGHDPIGATPSVIGAAGSAVNDAARHIPGVAQIEDVGSFFKWLGGNWDRVGIVFLGVILTILGALFIFKKQTTSVVTAAAKRG